MTPEHREPRVTLERRVRRAIKAQQERREPRVTLGHREHKVTLERRVM